MKFQLQHNMPDGFPLIIYGNNDYYEPMMQLKEVFNLRHNLYDKLEAVPKLTHILKCDIHNLFSADDINILKQTYEITSINHGTKIFIKNIINDNVIKFQDSPKSKINEICSLQNEMSRKTYKTFTKWFNLSGIDPISKKNWSAVKIDTIVNDKIHLSFPGDFNDRFDCQLHLHDNEILLLGDKNAGNAPKVQYLNLLLKYLFTISSFSLNCPNLTSSNHMWGLYGDNGAGIALTYSLDDLIAVEVNNISQIKNKNFMFFKPVLYDEKYNPVLDFKICLNKYYGNNDKNALLQFFEKFALTKTDSWKHENELRFYKFSLSVFEGFASKYGLDISPQTCEGLSEYIELKKPMLIMEKLLFAHG